MLTTNILKSARYLLGWTQEELATKSNLSLGAIKRIEAKKGILSANASTINLLLLTFKQNGLSISFDKKTTSITLESKN